MTGVLYGLAQLCIRRRFVVLAVWLIVTIALVAVSHRLGDNTNDNLSLPGTDSQAATDALAKSFPDQSNGTSPIVLHAKSGKLTDAGNAEAVNKSAAAVAKEPNVASVVNPLTAQGATALSKDKTTGYLSVTLSVSPGSLSVEDVETIIDGANAAKAAGLEVETGGQLGQKVSKPATESSELIGIIAAMIILTLTFGTVVSMLLPILNAIVALLSTLAIIRMLGHVATVPTVAPTLATMIGLGVGIDYALFIVTRHFRGMREGLSIDESIARAAATSGGAVFFAGGTVTIALVSLAVAGIPLITTMGLMAAVAVVVAVLAALTLLPATLAITGPRINSLRVRAERPESKAHEGLWAKWANEIARYPLVAGLAALAILIPLTIPLLSLNLGQQDVAALSESTTARKAYDLLARSFGPGINGPLIVAVTLGSPATASSASGKSGKSASSGSQASKPQSQGDPRAADPRLQTLQKDISQTPDVAAVTPVQIDKAGTSAFFNVVSTEGPAEEATTDLVEKLRASVIPTAAKGTDMKADVGGSTAGYIDLASRISDKLPVQILVVIALSFVLLILAFRTAVIPAQAAVMNLLSIGASYGVLTAIFQYGWLADVIGLNGPVPIVSYV
ncbi:MAG TPA: MMPL family transporter, partial [Solirubrobacteraceae bacterium]|nr:MMPL family transporter [Solirubrobacteraceae bacterium]